MMLNMTGDNENIFHYGTVKVRNINIVWKNQAGPTQQGFADFSTLCPKKNFGGTGKKK